MRLLEFRMSNGEGRSWVDLNNIVAFSKVKDNSSKTVILMNGGGSITAPILADKLACVLTSRTYDDMFVQNGHVYSAETGAPIVFHCDAGDCANYGTPHCSCGEKKYVLGCKFFAEKHHVRRI